MSAPERIWIDRGPKGGWMKRFERMPDSEHEYVRADIPAARIAKLEAENARLRDALKASREVHCGIAEHILERRKYPADGPVNTKGIFADSQRARLAVDAALDKDRAS